MKIFKIISVLAFALLLAQCEEYDPSVSTPLSYGFKFNEITTEVAPESPAYQVEVFATQTADVDRVVNIMLDEEASTAIVGDIISYPTSVTIPAGSLVGYGEVRFNTDNFSYDNDRFLVFYIQYPDDGSIVNNTVKTTTLNYVLECDLSKVQLDLAFDQYPSETSWELYDGANNLVASVPQGTYPDADFGNGSFSQVFCLADDTYSLVLYDSYGDGFCCAYGNGTYTVTVAGEVAVQGNGDFTSYRVVEFTVGD